MDSLQSPYSLIRRGLAEREIPWSAAHGTGVICYSPMQSGILTDSFSADRVAAFAADDWRRKSPEFREPRLSANVALRDALRPIAARHETTVSAIAVAWTLATPGVTGAIVGARFARQVDGWIRCRAHPTHRRRHGRNGRGGIAHAAHDRAGIEMTPVSGYALAGPSGRAKPGDYP